MVITNRIAVGSRVVGKHGPLIPNPSGGKRRIRSTAYGTVIRATEKGEWDVRFDLDGRRKIVRNTTLKVVDSDMGIPLDELETSHAETTEEPTASITTANCTTNDGGTTQSGLVSRFFYLFFLV